MAIAKTVTVGPIRESAGGNLVLTVGPATAQVLRTKTTNKALGKGGTKYKAAITAAGSARPTGANKKNHKQNAGNSSVGFQELNNQITSLDAQYDALANKAPWLTYAANIAGEWSLCANCAPSLAGKKLFRQYNFNRILQLNLVINAPVDDTATCADPQMFWIYDTTDIVPTATIAGDVGWTAPVWYTAPLGRGMLNPTVLVDNTTINIPQPAGTPIWVWMTEVLTLNGGILQPPPSPWQMVCCVSDSNGAPGFKSVYEGQII